MGEPDNVLYFRTRDQVVAGVQGWILDERLGAGDRLPPAKELAATLQASSHSVRQALGVLESIRLLKPGPDGCDVVGAERSTVVERLLRLRMALSGFSRGDLMSVRLDLERVAAARAATAATTAELAALRRVVREMTDSAVDYVRFGELDCEFHLLLAQAGHNGLATLLLTALSDAMHNEMLAAYQGSPHWWRTAQRLASEHQQILHAVANRDPHQAADVVAGHIGRFYDLQVG